MKRLIGLVFALVMIGGVAAPTEAAFALRICAGAGPCTAADTVASQVASGGLLSVPFATVGGFNIFLATAASDSPGDGPVDPNPDIATLLNSQLQVTRTGAGIGTLTVEVSSQDFTLPGDPFTPMILTAGLGGTSTNATTDTRITGQGFAHTGNAFFGLTNGTLPIEVCTGLLNGSLTGDCAGLGAASTSFFTRAGGPYSISSRTTITLDQGTNVSTLLRVNAVAVPEPGSMVLLGTGLFGLAGVARRRFARKTA